MCVDDALWLIILEATLVMSLMYTFWHFAEAQGFLDFRAMPRVWGLTVF
jgi:hypothetical protein